MSSSAELEKVLKQRRPKPRLSESHTLYFLPCLQPRVRSRELSDFTRQLATMMSARLPLVRSLEIIAQQQQRLAWRKVLQTLIANLKSGRSFSNSLAQHPQIFSSIFVNLVQVGEISGNLAAMLLELAAYLEKLGELKRKLLTAMAYPAVIVLVACGALGFLLFGIMPTFTDLFREFGVSLPFATRVLLASTDFVRAYGLYVMLGFIGLGLWGRAFAQTKNGRVFTHRAVLRLPLAGNLLKKVLLARFARTLGTLLTGGVSLLEALEITAQASGNLIFQQEVLRMKRLAAQGEALEKALTRSAIFPPFVVQMIAVGEETAELGAMLHKTAQFYESEIDAAIDALTSIIEPIIIVVLGLLLGGAIIAIYLQLFEVMNVVQ